MSDENRKAFQESWQKEWPNDSNDVFELSKGQYVWPSVQDTFDGWNLHKESLPAEAIKAAIGAIHSQITMLKLADPYVYAAKVNLLEAAILQLRALIGESK